MTEPEYWTPGGIPLTDEIIEQLAAEAEAGYDVEQLRPRVEAQARLVREVNRLAGKAAELYGRLHFAQARFDRIAEAHHKNVDEHGGSYGDCGECGWIHPCPTYVWATTQRDPLAPWDPHGDEEASDA